jgi:Trehalase
VDFLNRNDAEDVNGAIPNAQAWDWMKANVPFFSCPDSAVELTYYYRWWAWRKHIEKTPGGYVITEFLKPVKHATDYNAISCALGLHINEGRWLRDPRYLDDYVNFWLHSGDGGGLQRHYHQFSGWTADALYDRWLADGNTPHLLAQFEALGTDYRAWEQERLTESGLFWQRDVSDGMESSISGGRQVKNLRPTINSYMYGNAKALAAMAAMAGNSKLRAEYQRKAAALQRLVEEKLWNADAKFFETVKEAGGFADVREEHGYTPWYFNLPEPGKGYEAAWKQLMDPQGFYAPFGPTTAERRHAEFQIAGKGDDCQWNGPGWPFATSITLRGLANLLNGPHQDAISNQDYFQTFLLYSRSQRLKLANGQTVPWVDEDINPLTGEWWARALKMRKAGFYGRGDHYNHSSFADLVITGAVGLRPRADNVVEVNPLAPDGTWDWFGLDRVPYHGHVLSILWDKDGSHFKRGQGLRVLADGKEIAHSATLARTTGRL